MLNNYDKIANQYDALSRLVFSKSQVNAQINQLKYISKNSLILIVGGGTGWILEEISKLHTSGLNIVYVEISAKMMELSKRRNFEGNKLEFVNTGIEEFHTELQFDVVLTPFLFDNFVERRAERVFFKLNLLLKNNGLWFFVDFSLKASKGKWWKTIILKSMYNFFKMLGIVEANKLVDMQPHFLKAEYIVIEQKFYYGNFISAEVYKK